jgi:hypothetical protein
VIGPVKQRSAFFFEIYHQNRNPTINFEEKVE